MALRGPISSALQWRGLRGVTLRSPARAYVGLGPVRTCPMRQATRAICYRSIMSKTPYPPAQHERHDVRPAGGQRHHAVPLVPLHHRRRCREARERQAQAQRLPRQHQPRRVKGGPRGCAREPVARHLRTVAFRAMMRARAGGRRRGRRARLGLWRPGLRQREVSGVQQDDFPNAFLPPFVRSATIQ